MLLIVGGSKDHNIARLADAANARGFQHRVVHTDAVPAPDVRWRVGDAAITINGETFVAAGTALFIRYDVFGDAGDASRGAFYDAIKGWAAANPAVGLFNRRNETLEVSKPRALALAAQCGFEIPETHVASDFNRFADRDAYIVKPVAGGDYTRLLRDAGNPDGRPWIVQEKLAYPEMRLFRAGRHYFAFAIYSEALDYRSDKTFQMRAVTPPPELRAAMEKLSNRMGLDYAAADLKTDPATGRLKFLEINSMPMLTGYDNVAQGRLSDAMVLGLRDLGRKPVKARAPSR